MDFSFISFSRIIAYLRKSRADGEESVEEVLAKHERILREYCQRTYHAELPEERIFREVQSGETIASRPVMQRLIRMIQNKEVDAVLCVDLQRLSRGDLSDVGELSKLFQYTGCKIITPQRTYNVADEYDRKFFEMEIMHGNDYLEYIKKIMARGRKQSAMDGNYIGSLEPYGYSRVFVEKRPTLAVKEEEARFVRLIFEWYTGEERLGTTEIARRLNALGSKPRKSDAWSAASVRTILINPVYMGKITWERRKIVKQYVEGNLVVTRPWAKEGDYILADAKHPALIAPEVFEIAQEIRTTKQTPPAHEKSELVNPLAGLLVCGQCGKKMVYRHGAPSFSVPYLLCPNGDCTTRASQYTRVFAQLRSSLWSTLVEYQSKIKEGREGRKESAPDNGRGAAEKELAELRKQQKKQFELLERGIYSEEIFLERSTEINARIAAVTAELAKIGEKEKTEADILDFCSNLRQCIEMMDSDNPSPKKLNAMFKRVIEKIDYTRERSPKRRWDDTPLSLQVSYII